MLKVSIKSRRVGKAICLCKRISSKQQKKTGPRTRNHKNSPIFAQRRLRNSGADRETKYARFPSQRYKIYGTQVGEITHFPTNSPSLAEFPAHGGKSSQIRKTGGSAADFSHLTRQVYARSACAQAGAGKGSKGEP